jgi:NAD(P)-dependent dehydrogenase (short-subunit alcohol dehydrogenase family)
VVVVTGAGRGIGRATVLALVARGTSLLAVDVDAAAAEEVASAAAAHSRSEVVPHPADVSDEESVRSLIEVARSRWGGIDGVFNNAAVLGPVEPIATYRSDDFDAVLRTNVRGAWLCAKYALPLLRASGGGVIVNTASTAGLTGWPRLSGYVCAKHAVVGLTRALSVECAPEGIRVNAICPGPTDTDMIRSIEERVAGGDPALGRRLQERNVPAGRVATPDEVAAVASWLLLDAPPYMTGAIVAVDGGQTAGFGPQVTQVGG